MSRAELSFHYFFKITKIKCRFIFEDKSAFDFGDLEKVMEGKFRPGHFKGVAQVVSRLFEITDPDNAYFGEKDFQQLVIVKELVKQKEFRVKITGCPTMRE